VTYRGVIPLDQGERPVALRRHGDPGSAEPALRQYRLRGGTVMNNVATVASRKFENGERRDYGGPGSSPEVFARTHAARTGDARLRRQGQELVCCTTASRGLAWTRATSRLAGRCRASHPAITGPGWPAWRSRTGGASGKLERRGRRRCALRAYEQERYLRTARVTITFAIFGDIIHANGGARDLRNHLPGARERPKPSGRWTGFTGGSKFDRGPRYSPCYSFLVLVAPHHPSETGADSPRTAQKTGRESVWARPRGSGAWRAPDCKRNEAIDPAGGLFMAGFLRDRRRAATDNCTKPLAETDARLSIRCQ